MAYKRTPGYKYAESNPKGNKPKVKLTEGEERHNAASKKLAKMLDRADSIGDIFPSAATPEDEQKNTASKKLAKMLDRADSIGDIFPSAATPKDTDAMLAAKMAYNEQVKPQVTKPGKTVKGKSTK